MLGDANMLKTAKGRKAGFTLIELLIVIAIIALLIGILLPALGEARRAGRKTLCMANMRSYAQAINSFAIENKDQLAAPNWKGNQQVPPEAHPSLLGTKPGSDFEGGALHVVSTIWKKTGVNPRDYTVPGGWIAYILYSHIPLNDYIGGNLPSQVAACPEDTVRLAWQKNWQNPEGAGLPYPSNSNGDNGGQSNWRWPFSSSYSVHTVHWGPSRGGVFNGKGMTMYWVQPEGPAGGGGSFYTSNTPAGLGVDGSFGRNKLTDVRFISSKTIMSDEFARHQGRKVRYYADPDASQPLNFYDGSVREYKTGETNPGWTPANRGSMRDRLAHRKDRQVYDPVFVYTPQSAGGNQEVHNAVAGWYRYTRGGLFGWDVPRGPRRAGITGAGSGRKLDTTEENELNTNTQASGQQW
jgi:prepilin-type N-terminal cleavage/methylation domain-containing protein